MEDDQILLSNIEDRIRQTTCKNMITNSKFLDSRQRLLAENVCKRHKEPKSIYYGGYPEAERTVCLFLPDYIKANDLQQLADYFVENPEENPLTVLSIKKDGFSTLSHRDYLGSMMGLGIKREMLGDILVREDGCDIILLKSILIFLMENLQKAGRGTLHTEIKDFKEIIVPEQKMFDKSCVVASLRLDNIACAAFDISRGLAAEAINKGQIYLNGLLMQKTDAKVAQGDKIVLRGKGKVLVKEILGETKKSRIKIILEKFI